VRDDLNCPNTEKKILKSLELFLVSNLILSSFYYVHSFLFLFAFPYATYLEITFHIFASSISLKLCRSIF